MFCYSGPRGGMTLPQQHVVYVLTPLLRGIGFVVSQMTARVKTRRVHCARSAGVENSMHHCLFDAKLPMYRAQALSLSLALVYWIHYAVTPAFSNNSIRRSRCCCYKPTAHCNKSRDSVELLENLRLRCKQRPALQRLTN